MRVVWQVRAKARGVLAQAAFGLVSDFDGWAGYPGARGRLLASLRGAASGSGRVAVYTHTDSERLRELAIDRARERAEQNSKYLKN